MRRGDAAEADRVGKRINRRTAVYGISVCGASAAMIVSIVWLGSRRGECFGSEQLVCAAADRGLLVFLPSAMLALGTVGAFLRASPRWHRLRRLYIRPYLGWVLAAVTITYGTVSSAVLF